MNQNSNPEQKDPITADDSDLLGKGKPSEQAVNFQAKVQKIGLFGKWIIGLINPASALVIAVVLILVFSLVTILASYQTIGRNENACENGSDCEVAEKINRQSDCSSPLSAGNIESISNTFSLGSGEKERQQRLMKELMSRLKITKAQAAGIVGNLMAESGPALNPAAVNGSSGATGWVQWLGGRRDAFKVYAQKNNYPWLPNDAANLSFLVFETTQGSEKENYSKFVAKTKSSDDPRLSAAWWDNLYERSETATAHAGGKLINDVRENNAQNVFKGLGSSGEVSTTDQCESLVGGVSGPLLDRIAQRAEMVLALSKQHPGGPACVPGFNGENVFSCGDGWGKACTAISMMIWGHGKVGIGRGGVRATNGYVPGQKGTSWPPPPGAVVSWPYPGNGHVAVHLGNGEFIDNWPDVARRTHTQYLKGAKAVWVLPPESWEGTFLNNGA